jgi:hypothetical protein
MRLLWLLSVQSSRGGRRGRCERDPEQRASGRYERSPGLMVFVPSVVATDSTDLGREQHRGELRPFLTTSARDITLNSPLVAYHDGRSVGFLDVARR